MFLDEMSRTILWTLIGVALLCVEITTLSFFLLFFGISALVVAGARLVGLDYLPFEILLFAAGGAAGALLLRKHLVRTRERYHTDHNQRVELSADVVPGGTTTIEYQGSQWTAVNGSDETLKKGDVVGIERCDGVKLVLKRMKDMPRKPVEDEGKD